MCPLLPTAFRWPDAKNPFKPGDRARLVAFAEIVVARHFDEVGHADQAAYQSERQPARYGERDPVLQSAFGADGPAASDESE